MKTSKKQSAAVEAESLARLVARITGPCSAAQHAIDALDSWREEGGQAYLKQTGTSWIVVKEPKSLDNL